MAAVSNRVGSSDSSRVRDRQRTEISAKDTKTKTEAPKASTSETNDTAATDDAQAPRAQPRPSAETARQRSEERDAVNGAHRSLVERRLHESVAPSSVLTEELGDGHENCLEDAATMARPHRDEVVFMDDRRSADDGNANQAGHTLVRDRASGRVWDPNDGPAPANPQAWPYRHVDAWTAAQGPAADRGPAYAEAGAVPAQQLQDILSRPPEERPDYIATQGDPTLSAVADRVYADDEGTSPQGDPEAQRRAVETVTRNLDDSGLFNRVTRDETSQAVDAIAGLSPTDARAVIQTLDRNGQLDRLSTQLERYGDSEAGAAIRTRFAQAMGRRLDGAGLATVAESMRGAGEDSRAAFVDGMNRTASVDTKLDFVRATAARTTDGTPSRRQFESNWGSSSHTSFQSDGDAASVAGVISSLRGQDAERAFGLLSNEQRTAVFDGAANVRDVTFTAASGGMAPSMPTSWQSADTEGFDRLVRAAGSIPDAQLRAQYLDESLGALGRAGEVQGRDRAAMASSVLGQLDGETLAGVRPDNMAALADGLAQTRGGPGQALQTIEGFEPSANRDALVRTMFLKTSERTFRDSPELAGQFARGLAAAEGGDDPAAAAQRLQRALSTENGRSLLVDNDISGQARLWAAREVMNGSDAARGALQDDKPWENAGLLESHARARMEQFAVRGDQAVAVSGDNIDNLVGAGLGAPMREDLPQTESGIAGAQERALDGNYNFYEGVEVVEKVADGIREAQERMGGGEISVATLPIQFSSQETGPVDLQIYRVEGQNGQERFVDNVGRVYENFEAWREENDLPPGQQTFPAGGRLGEPGETRMVTENTPDVSDTFWEHVGDVADVAALAGGVVASGVILVGSGGTATPLVAGAWGVALGSAGYMGIKAGAELYDRHSHGQTLSLSDPDARAAWLSLAGSGLTVAGAGVMRGATALAGQGSRWAPAAARAAGILNASANFTDAGAAVDQANSLVQNWDKLTPAQRAQMGLSIAFWGGMTGVSARASGGRVTDAFSFRAQMNSALIQSGAAIRANPNMAAGHARVNTGYTDGGRLNLSVEYGPGTSRTSIDIHRDVARSLIDNSGVQGAIRRTLGDGTQFRPGSRGEEIALEVTKHQALIRAYDEQIPNAPTREQAALRAERDGYVRALQTHEAELARLRADPAAANAAGIGHIDAVTGRSVQGAQRYVDQALARTDITPEARTRLTALQNRLNGIDPNKIPDDANGVSSLLRVIAEVDSLAPPAANAAQAAVRPPRQNLNELAADPRVAAEAERLYPDIYRRLRHVSDSMFRGRTANVARPQIESMARAEALRQAQASIAGPLPGLTPGAPARTNIDPNTDFPMGFRSRASFDSFAGDLNGAARAQAADAQLIVQGSSVTGRRFDRAVDMAYTDAPFGVGRLSDYDVAIVSDELVRRAQQRGVRLPTDRALSQTEMNQLGLGDLYRQAQAAALRETGLAYPVNFRIYSSSNVPDTPSLPLAGG